MRCLFILLPLLLFGQSVCLVAQKCERPDTVYIPFKLDSYKGSAEYSVRVGENETFFYEYQIYKEVFCLKKELGVISELELAKITFQSPDELRKMESAIIKCEIEKGGGKGSIYLDTNINSVFRNIVLVQPKNDKYVAYLVEWYEYLE